MRENKKKGRERAKEQSQVHRGKTEGESKRDTVEVGENEPAG